MHVKDLSLGFEPDIRCSHNVGENNKNITNFIRKCNEHESMAWPDVEVIPIEQERWVSETILPCGHFEFNVLMGNVFLVIIHPD